MTTNSVRIVRAWRERNCTWMAGRTALASTFSTSHGKEFSRAVHSNTHSFYLGVSSSVGPRVPSLVPPGTSLTDSFGGGSGGRRPPLASFPFRSPTEWVSPCCCPCLPMAMQASLLWALVWRGQAPPTDGKTGTLPGTQDAP